MGFSMQPFHSPGRLSIRLSVCGTALYTWRSNRNTTQLCQVLVLGKSHGPHQHIENATTEKMTKPPISYRISKFQIARINLANRTARPFLLFLFGENELHLLSPLRFVSCKCKPTPLPRTEKNPKEPKSTRSEANPNSLEGIAELRLSKNTS